MNDITHLGSQSPFDSIRRVRDDGSEFWSGRDLMPLLGYDQWRRFEDAVERAKASATSQGMEPDHHFVGAGKMVPIGSGAFREAGDVHLTRFGAYLVAMNGDPRKPEVAAAQAYFAVRTREAEVAQPRELTYDELMVKALTAADDKVKALTAQIEADASKVDLAERYLATPGNGRVVREVAKAIGWTERQLRALLIEEHLIFRRQSLCGEWTYDFYSEFREHFTSRETVVAHGFGNCSHYTVYVTPRGVDLIRKRIAARRVPAVV